MARTRSSSSSSARWMYINPAYYLKRPKRLAFLFIAFVFFTFFFWDRQTLVREHEKEIYKLKLDVTRLQNELEELKNVEGGSGKKTTLTDTKTNVSVAKGLQEDPIEVQRQEKVKDAMRNAWTAYEKYAWGNDELQYVAFSHCFRTEAGAAGASTRAKLEKNEKLLDFVHNLEAACIETVETGKMTKDLAILVHGPNVEGEYYLNTEEFTDVVAQNLESKLPAPSTV